MISKELLKKVHYIEIKSAKIVNSVLAGEYKSVFKGRGLEFSDVREYQFGDDVRSIDWNVTARMGHPYIKNYIEEREQSIFFLVDLSASGSFGSMEKTKNEIATELCGLLAFSAIKNNDRVSLIVFTDRIELFIPPAKGTTHVLRIIRELLNFTPKGIKTDISHALTYLNKIEEKRSIVFIISDFDSSDFSRELSVLNERHDIIGVSIRDPREYYIPEIGLVEFTDPESGEKRLFDSSNKKIRKNYISAILQKQKSIQQLFHSKNIDLINIHTNDDYITKLISFFRTRGNR